MSFEIFVAIELEIRTCNHLHACQPVNLSSVVRLVTPAIKSKLCVCCIGQCSVQAGPRAPYWTWALGSIRTRKNTELTEEANCSIHIHVH